MSSWIHAILIVALCAGCSMLESPMAGPGALGPREVAIQFTKALADRNYVRAPAMTSRNYKKRVSIEQMRTAFEAIVPTNWGVIGPIEVVGTMTEWRLPAQ
jgi:hypothetical protein